MMDNNNNSSAISCVEVAIDNLNRAKDIMMEIAASDMMEQIVLSVSDYYGLEPVKMKAETKETAYERPRKIVMYLCSKLTQAPSKSIARLLGLNNVSDVLRGSQIIEVELPLVASLRKDVNAIVEAVRKSDERNQTVYDDEKDLLTCYRSLSDNAKVEIQGLIKYLLCSEGIVIDTKVPDKE